MPTMGAPVVTAAAIHRGLSGALSTTYAPIALDATPTPIP
jgi:hypothetical protein